MLNLDVRAVTSVAIIRGIEIIPEGPLPNQPPTISASPNPVNAPAGQTTVVGLTTDDPEGDPVTTLDHLRSGVRQHRERRPAAVARTPGDVAGSPYTVTVEASDGDLTASVDVAGRR